MVAGLDGGQDDSDLLVDEAGKIVWRGTAETHPNAIAVRLKGFQDKLVKVGLESGPFHAASASFADRYGLCDGVHRCTAGQRSK